MKKVAGYVRVSTQEQAIEGHSVPAQKERLIAYCKAKDWLLADMYVDAGFSGSSLDRPAMERLLDNIKKYDIVLVYKLDRLSRSQRDTIHLIEDIFLPANVSFVSMNESFDTGTPFGRAMIGILSVFAQLEREQIKERMDMGRYARAKLGKRNGAAKPPMGYDYDPNTGKLVINEYEAEQVRAVFSMLLEGYSYTRIARCMREKGFSYKGGKWDHSSVIHHIIANRAYIGESVFKDLTIKNAHPAIIEEDVFDTAQDVAKDRYIKFEAHFVDEGRHLLTGLLYCGECGTRCGVAKRSGNFYWVCYASKDKGGQMARGKECAAKNIREDLLDAMVDYEVRNLCFDTSYFDKLLSENTSQKSKRKPVNVTAKKAEELGRQIDKLMELYTLDQIPADVISSKINALYAQKAKLLEQIDQSGDSARDKIDYSYIRGLLRNTADLWDEADIQQKRLLLSALIRKIYVYEDHIDIRWSFQPNDVEEE